MDQAAAGGFEDPVEGDLGGVLLDNDSKGCYEFSCAYIVGCYGRAREGDRSEALSAAEG